MQGGKVSLLTYAKIKKAYKNYRLLSGLKKQLSNHDGVLFLHDTHFSSAVPKRPKFLVYDCVDLPLMHQRTSLLRRNKNKYLKLLIDCNARKAVKKADLISMTSPFYKKFLSSWIGDTTTQILLRNFTTESVKDLPRNVELEKILQSEADITHWLVIHNRIGQFLDVKGVLKAVSKLKNTWGICFLGVFDGKNTSSQIQDYAQKFCPAHKVLCCDPLYGDEKLAALKCFDLGLVPLIAESQNLQRCIPNRTLEFLGIGLPQIVSRTIAFKSLSNQFPDSIFMPTKKGQEAFENTLLETCEKVENRKIGLSKSNIPFWSDDFENFYKALSERVDARQINKDVIILSENNPYKNNRLAKIQDGLIEKGYKCSVLEIDQLNSKIIKHFK